MVEDGAGWGGVGPGRQRGGPWGDNEWKATGASNGGVMGDASPSSGLVGDSAAAGVSDAEAAAPYSAPLWSFSGWSAAASGGAPSADDDPFGNAPSTPSYRAVTRSRSAREHGMPVSDEMPWGLRPFTEPLRDPGMMASDGRMLPPPTTREHFAQLTVTSAAPSSAAPAPASGRREVDKAVGCFHRQDSNGSSSSTASNAGSANGRRDVSAAAPAFHPSASPFSDAEFRAPTATSATVPPAGPLPDHGLRAAASMEPFQGIWAPVPHRSVAGAVRSDSLRTPSPSVDAFSFVSSPARARSASQFSSVSTSDPQSSSLARSMTGRRQAYAHYGQALGGTPRYSEETLDVHRKFSETSAPSPRLPYSSSSMSSTSACSSSATTTAAMPPPLWNAPPPGSDANAALQWPLSSSSSMGSNLSPRSACASPGGRRGMRYAGQDGSWPSWQALTSARQTPLGAARASMSVEMDVTAPTCGGGYTMPPLTYPGAVRMDPVGSGFGGAGVPLPHDASANSLSADALARAVYRMGLHTPAMAPSETAMPPLGTGAAAAAAVAATRIPTASRRGGGAGSTAPPLFQTLPPAGGRGLHVIDSEPRPVPPTLPLELGPALTPTPLDSRVCRSARAPSGRRHRNGSFSPVSLPPSRTHTPNAYPPPPPPPSSCFGMDPHMARGLEARGLDVPRAAATAAGVGALDSSASLSQVSRSALLETFRALQMSGAAEEVAATDDWTLAHIANHVVEFSTDQHGSRFIQTRLESASEAEVDALLEEILPDMNRLITDVFGNYVIQKLLEHGSANSIRCIAAKLKHRMLSLSLHMYGCRAVQKALEVFPAPIQAELVSELDGHVLKCIRDQNGNHVVQKCIERVPSQHVQFVVDAVREQAVALAEHSYGCRVIQRILEYSPEEQKAPILRHVMAASRKLLRDQYGNYVIQHVVEHAKEEHRAEIMAIVKQQCVALSQHKFASNVVERCLQYGAPADRTTLIELLVGDDALPPAQSPLVELVKDQFGNYVVQRILDIAGEAQRARAVHVLRAHIPLIKRYTYGKHILARIDAAGSNHNAVGGYRALTSSSSSSSSSPVADGSNRPAPSWNQHGGGGGGGAGHRNGRGPARPRRPAERYGGASAHAHPTRNGAAGAYVGSGRWAESTRAADI
ncbi:hypothetical protein CDCA_CDCA01G0059 [Cyanidium caldarium]|uniref:PUM-HD domain-containing protein n=1 Tax=Cyanidium caldarium TaxID=2771 RepID=A0AAV9IPG9_CYACA|nr:hypothetical protein CDCA_CDCA01G0059 [Cyanidium caldarium]